MAVSARRRQQRTRVIRRRLSIVRHWSSRYWNSFFEDSAWTPRSFWPPDAGRFDKHNLVCSCGICRGPKYRDAVRWRQWPEE